jgi:hypothetical protein
MIVAMAATGSAQRYVSEELTHFVGRRHGDDEEARYADLLAIVGGGYLGPRPDIHAKGVDMAAIGINPAEDEMYNPDMTCFCDIPLSEMGIHMRKYGRFGLAFLKEFVAARGGAPVLYVPKQAQIRGGGLVMRQRFERLRELDDALRELGFDESDPRYAEVVAERSRLMTAGEPPPDALKDVFRFWRRESWTLLDELYTYFNRRHVDHGERGAVELRTRVFALRAFLTRQIFSYTKDFDLTLAENDADNYYMEREWRVIGGVRFVPDDVTRIIAPEPFAKRLRQDLPDYTGQVHFA